MASDDTTGKLNKAHAKASATRSENDPWQEHFGRETTAQAVKSVQAADIIQGFSGSWAASYAFDWGAGITADGGSEARQDLSVPTPIREKIAKLGQPGFSDVDFVPYNWHTNRFANKGPSLIGHPISFEVEGPTLKSPSCDWTWAVTKGAGPNGGDYLVMDTDTDGNPALVTFISSGYNVSSYTIGAGSSEDDRGGFFLIVSSDGANPGSIPAGATPMGALSGHVDTARFEIFRVSAIGVDGGTGRGFIEIHPNKSFSDFFDLPAGPTRHIRAITLFRPKLTQLIAVPGSGPELGQEQTFVVVPPEESASPDNYPAWNGGVGGDGSWKQGGFDADGTGLIGSSSAYMGRSRVPVPLAIRQGSGRVEKNPGAPTAQIGTFIIENAVNGSAFDQGNIMRIYHVDSDDGDTLDHGSVNSTLGWYEIVGVDGGGTTYTLQRVAEIDPSTGIPYFGPGPYHMNAGDATIHVYFTIHKSVRDMLRSESFNIDDVQASRLDCLINPRDVERTTKQVSDPSANPLPMGSSPARADRAIFNTKFTAGTPIPEPENPGSLLDIGFRMVLFPAINPPPDEGLQQGRPDFNNPIYSHEVTLDPSVTDEKQFWEVDYSGGTIRLSHAPVSGGDFNPSGTGSDPVSNSPRGNLVLYAACVPYSREVCQKGAGVRIVGRGDEEDVDLFSFRIHSRIDGTNTPALGGSAPFFNGEVVLQDLLDVPDTGYFDVLDGDTPFFTSRGTWSYQSTRVQNFGPGDVTVLEGVYSDPNVGSPFLPSEQTVLIRRETFFGQESDDNSDRIDDHRFDTVYGSSARSCSLRFIGASCTLQIDGSVVVDASGIDVLDEGVEIKANAKKVDFIGSGVTAVFSPTGSGNVEVTIAGGVDVQDEGSPLLVNAQFVNFTGLGVAASLNGLGVDVDITGGVEVQDETALIQAAAAFLNFTGAGVTASVNAAGADITIPGGGGDWELVDGVVTVDSGADLIAFSLLDGDNDGIYCLIGRIANRAGYSALELRPNGLTSSQASYVIPLHSEGTQGSFSLFGERTNGSLVLAELGSVTPEGPTNPGGAIFIYFFMPRPKFIDGTDVNLNRRLGIGMFMGVNNLDLGAEGNLAFLDRFEMVGGMWNQNTSNVTSLEVALSAGDFATGSTVCLYRIKCDESGSGGEEIDTSV